jgi:hypothetical protein
LIYESGKNDVQLIGNRTTASPTDQVLDEEAIKLRLGIGEAAPDFGLFRFVRIIETLLNALLTARASYFLYIVNASS